MRLLFVCMGNICRSPTAEAVMRLLVVRAGLEDRIEVDSAGTGSWHVGHAPDRRATAAAAARGIELVGAARQVTIDDFDRFDLLLCADKANRADLLDRAPDAGAAERVALLRSFDPASVADGDLEIPDPYQGGPEGFERVLDVVEAACAGLLEELQAEGPIAVATERP